MGTTNLNSLQTTLFAESLSDIEIALSSVREDPRFEKIMELLDGSPTRALEKIVHKSNMNPNP